MHVIPSVIQKCIVMIPIMKVYVSVSGIDLYSYIITSIIQELSIDSHYVLLVHDGTFNMMH